MRSESLAELRTDPKGGYEIRDTRSGELLAWRGTGTSAGEVADFLNRAYPDLAPAHDTLVHEIIGARITGVAG